MVTLNFQYVQYFDPMHDVIITPKGQNIQNPKTGEADMLGPQKYAFQLTTLSFQNSQLLGHPIKSQNKVWLNRLTQSKCF